MNSKEYLMLREEILHLDQLIVNTINFFYAFLASFMAFSLTHNDTIYLLLAYIVILPAYLMVISKMNAMCKIGGYLKVFHEAKEDSEFKWETNNIKFLEQTAAERPRFTKMIMSFMYTFHYPFAVTNFATFILFIFRSNWECLTIYEILKIFICIALCIFTFLLIHENRKIGTEHYIKEWDNFKALNKDKSDNPRTS